MVKLLAGFLYLFGMALIVIGTLSVFATDLARRKFFNKLLQITDLKKYSPLSIIIGILLLLSATYNKHMLFILLLGVLAIVKGIALIVATEKMEKMKSWWLKANDSAYRIYGVILIILGSLILIGI